MNNIVYGRKTQEKKGFLLKSSCFNDRHLISKLGANFIEDCSLQKPLIKNKLAIQRKNLIKQKRLEVKRNLKRTEQKLDFLHFEQQNQDFKAKINFYINVLHKLHHECAVRIQAAVRGWIVRRKFEKEFLSLERKRMNNRLGSLQVTEVYCLLNIGAKLKAAAIRLQRFVRRCFFKRKIQRIKLGYEAYLESLKEPLYKIIKNGIQLYLAKCRITEIAFERHKTIRLVQIKRNLAIIKIKTILNKKKIKIKLLKHKIRRQKKLAKYSNRLSLISSPIENKRLIKNINEKKHMSVIISPIDTLFLDSGAGSNLRIAPDNQILEVPESAELKSPIGVLNEEIKIEVKQEPAEATNNFPSKPVKKRDKRRLNIRKPKDLNIIPLLYERELENRPQTHHYMSTTVSVYRMLEVNPSRSPPRLFNPKAIRIHSAFHKSLSPPTLNYLQQTVCSRLKSHKKRKLSADGDKPTLSLHKSIFFSGRKGRNLSQKRKSEDLSGVLELQKMPKQSIGIN